MVLNFGSNKSALTGATNSNGDTAQSSGDLISESVPGSAPQSDPPTEIPTTVKGDSRNSITQPTTNQSALGVSAEKENSSEPSLSESANLGLSTMPRSTVPVADAEAPEQLDPSRGSSPSSGKTVTQDSNPETHNHSGYLAHLHYRSGPPRFTRPAVTTYSGKQPQGIISYSQADFSESKIYSAALIATPTPRIKYEPDYLTKL
ncbi:hypothetical protein B9Z19DRAFT_1127008 [Tuber borchii]|uniref:Uncharacterized protein n=1 Tax=Tuber borchii TaxID=42251 RepID=A0A2T6ZS35_TUBBO|nr:hypothetical protein B9Z19DRAFT_1127008 [Tuber borchii]